MDILRPHVPSSANCYCSSGLKRHQEKITWLDGLLFYEQTEIQIPQVYRVYLQETVSQDSSNEVL
jgi:hypothetical protein